MQDMISEFIDSLTCFCAGVMDVIEHVREILLNLFGYFH